MFTCLNGKLVKVFERPYLGSAQVKFLEPQVISINSPEWEKDDASCCPSHKKKHLDGILAGKLFIGRRPAVININKDRKILWPFAEGVGGPPPSNRNQFRGIFFGEDGHCIFFWKISKSKNAAVNRKT